MPKTKAQKRYQGGTPAKTAQGVKHTMKAQGTETVIEASSARPAPAAVQSAMASKRRAGATQALVMAGMLAVGCWGLAFSFIFLTTTANHVLVGGMIAVMAVMWTFSFVMRLRKAQGNKR